MVEPMKKDDFQKPGQRQNPFLKEKVQVQPQEQEQIVIDSIAETLENQENIEFIPTPQQPQRTFLSVVMACVPYVIMGMGAYMIYTRARGFFKSPRQDEGTS